MTYLQNSEKSIQLDHNQASGKQKMVKFGVRYGIPLSLMAITAFFAFGLYFEPALFMDDWTSVVERVATGTARWFDPDMRRPLLFTPFLLQRLFELTEGRTLAANIALVLNNARLAALIAQALAT